MKQLKGVFPALVTPFDGQGEVNEKMLRKVIDYQIQAGVEGFYMCGGTGEGLLLTTQERKHILEVIIDQVKGRAAVIDHICAFQTKDTEELARHAKEAGADAISCLPPTFFYKPDLDGLIQYYKRIAGVTDLPLLVYNIPQRTGINITPAIMQRLMKIPNIIGLKHATMDIFQLRNLIELEKGKLTAFEGEDPVFLPALIYGANGGIGCTYNVMPHLFSQVYDLFLKKEYDRAAEIQFKINRIINVLGQFDVIASTKETMCMMGFEVGPPRTPNRPMTSEEKAQLRKELKRENFFSGL